MRHIPVGNTTIFKRTSATGRKLVKTDARRTLYRPRVQSDPVFVCDRCADENAAIAGVIVMPDAGQAQLFCARCFGRTSIIRRTHPEWKVFEVSGPVTIEELAATLAAQGFIPADSSKVRAVPRAGE